MSNSSNAQPGTANQSGLIYKLLAWVERIGNKLPDPAVLFVFGLLLVWVLSAIFSGYEFTVPSKDGDQVRSVVNQLSGKSLAEFLASMVDTFTGFHPLGVVLVALLGVGVAEHTGFINAGLKSLISLTPRKLLSPMLLLVAIISHTAADAGYVLVIPLGGIIFHAAGRHPLAGIACAFAGVSGGFSANFIPSGIDPLLQGFTQSAAQVLDAEREVNPLCNWWFTGASSVLVIAVGWFITDKIIEPRFKNTALDGEDAGAADMGSLSVRESKGLWAGILTMLVGVLILVACLWPEDSPLRTAEGEITNYDAPVMDAIVPLIFLLFLFPAIVFGYVAGTIKNHRDIIQGMTKSMQTMGYYLVMIFFCAQFTAAFGRSEMGALLAVKGAAFLQALGLPGMVTIVGIILLTTVVNLLVGSASGKWALLAPIFVPILMQLGLSPELTQAAYRVGDSTTNIITPLMPYFPLVVAFCQRWVKSTGIGTVTSMMLPFSISMLVTWTLFLLLYWMIGFPLGLQATYTYP